MNPIGAGLRWLAGRGRYVLVAGLVTGMFAEPAAIFLKEWIPELAVCLLFLAAFRVGLKAALGAARDFRRAILFVIIFQVIVPVAVFVLFSAVGWTGILPAAIALLSSGASVSAAPHLAVMTGHAPAPALRVLVLGTALLPATIIPVLWLLPQFGSAASVLSASLNLFLVIGLSAAVAFAVRRTVFSQISEDGICVVDGLSAVFLYLIVVGLMAAVGPALRNDLPLVLVTLAAAFAINFGLQLLFFMLLRNEVFAADRVPLSIIAGNRNMALFLTALPVSVTDPMLLFIGCYQIPMYLTPVLLGRLYASVGSGSKA